MARLVVRPFALPFTEGWPSSAAAVVAAASFNEGVGNSAGGALRSRCVAVRLRVATRVAAASVDTAAEVGLALGTTASSRRATAKRSHGLNGPC